MGLEDLTCFYGAINPISSLSCLTSSFVSVSSILYISLLLIMVVGWSFYRDFAEGLLIGSFGGVAVGLALILLEWLTIDVWMISVVLFFIALIVVVIRKSGND